jgi:hypothetical protein
LRKPKKAGNILSLQDTITTNVVSFRKTTDWFTDSLATSFDKLSTTQTLTDSIEGTFFHPQNVGTPRMEIVPLVKAANPNEWMLTTMIALLVFMIFLWYLMPGRRSLFQQFKQSLQHPGEMAIPKNGLLFSFFFYLNYLTVLVLIIILSVNTFAKPATAFGPLSQLTVLTSLAFVGYSFYKLVFIAVAGFFFKTQTAAARQIRLYIDIDNISGFILLLLLLLALSTQNSYFFYFGVFLILIFNGIKWFQTFAIGKSIPMYKLYHLIIYLCTLEIIPLILLAKLVKNMGI